MPIRAFKDKWPIIDASAYIDDMCVIIGDVAIGADSSVWPMCVIRGDDSYVRIGAGANIQDGAVIHVGPAAPPTPSGVPTLIGDYVSIGHRSMLHACAIEDGCLVGMSSTVLDGAVLRKGALLGAGSLVPPGKELEGGHLWMGRPVKQVRELTAEEMEMLLTPAKHYARIKDQYLAMWRDHNAPARRKRRTRNPSIQRVAASG